MKSITINQKDYQLEITTRTALNMEERMGYNPINVIIAMRDYQLPKMKDLMIMFHCALQKYQHGISYDDAINLFQQYCNEGGGVPELVEVIIHAFEDGGLIKSGGDPNAQ